MTPAEPQPLLTRADWLATRKIGSSDAASACGLEDAFGSPLSVYLEKCGLMPRKQNRLMKWGLLLEDVVATAYQEETGIPVRLPAPAGTYLSFETLAYPWASATPDRFAGESGDEFILELKTANHVQGWGEPGTDEIPPCYLVQVQHQMAVLGKERADVAVLIGGSEFRHYTIRRNDDLICTMMRLEAELWDRIQRGDPPSVDWAHPDTPRLLAHLYQPIETKTITLGTFSALYAEEYELLGKTITQLEAQRDQCKARITQEMQDAGFGILPDGRRVRRKLKHVREYTVPAREEVEFRIVKAESPKTTNRRKSNVATEVEG